MRVTTKLLAVVLLAVGLIKPAATQLKRNLQVRGNTAGLEGVEYPHRVTLMRPKTSQKLTARRNQNQRGFTFPQATEKDIIYTDIPKLNIGIGIAPEPGTTENTPEEPDTEKPYADTTNPPGTTENTSEEPDTEKPSADSTNPEESTDHSPPDSPMENPDEPDSENPQPDSTNDQNSNDFPPSSTEPLSRPKTYWKDSKPPQWLERLKNKCVNLKDENGSRKSYMKSVLCDTFYFVTERYVMFPSRIVRLFRKLFQKK